MSITFEDPTIADQDLDSYSAWLIEHGASSVHCPRYLAVTSDGVSTWTDDADAALQFARESDATNLARNMAPGIGVRVAEHGFWIE